MRRAAGGSSRPSKTCGGFADEGARWSALDGYYVPTRYPNSLPGSIPARVYTREAAAGAVGLAEEMVRFVQERIPEPPA